MAVSKSIELGKLGAVSRTCGYWDRHTETHRHGQYSTSISASANGTSVTVPHSQLSYTEQDVKCDQQFFQRAVAASCYQQ